MIPKFISALTSTREFSGQSSVQSLSESRVSVLDGLRGIAILAVLLTHFTPDTALQVRAFEWVRKMMMAGWVGVDLFFVLSGFLITLILLDSKGSSHYWKNFMARRILRVFPLYFLALTVVFLLFPAFGLLHSAGFERLEAHQGWNWLYLTNFGMWLVGRNSFISDQISVAHFWSLCVEEHFYLIWPLIVFISSPQNLARICWGGIVVALVIRMIAVFWYSAPPLFFVITPCRIDGICIGAWLAIVARYSDLEMLNKAAFVVLMSCGAFLAGMFVCMKGFWPFNWLTQSIGLTIVSFFFGALLVVVYNYRDHGLIKKVFGSGFLCFFGKYSYGIYVIHGLLGGFFEKYLSPQTFSTIMSSAPVTVILVLASRIAISVILAMLSWHIMEKHLLSLKRYFRD